MSYRTLLKRCKMKKYQLAFTVLTTYLLLFAAVNLHRNPSGLRRKFSFRRIRQRAQVVYKEEDRVGNLTPLITKVFSLKAPSEPGDF